MGFVSLRDGLRHDRSKSSRKLLIRICFRNIRKRSSVV